MTPLQARCIGQDARQEGFRKLVMRSLDLAEQMAGALRSCGSTEVEIFEDDDRLPEVWWKPPAER